MSLQSCSAPEKLAYVTCLANEPCRKIEPYFCLQFHSSCEIPSLAKFHLLVIETRGFEKRGLAPLVRGWRDLGVGLGSV